MSANAVRRATVGAVLVVALVAAIVSYAHMQHLAELHGEGWRSVLIPLAVDGMLVAATLAIVSQRRHGRPAGAVPWLGLTLGILASLAANVAAARPELVAQLIAAWPPVALAVSIETLVVVLRAEPDVRSADTSSHTPDVTVSDPDQAGRRYFLPGAGRNSDPSAVISDPGRAGEPDVSTTDVVAELDGAGEPAIANDAGKVTGTRKNSDPDQAGEPDDVGSADPVAELIEAGAGRRKLAAELGLSEYRARVLLAERRNGVPR